MINCSPGGMTVRETQWSTVRVIGDNCTWYVTWTTMSVSVNTVWISISSTKRSLYFRTECKEEEDGLRPKGGQNKTAAQRQAPVLFFNITNGI